MKSFWVNSLSLDCTISQNHMYMGKFNKRAKNTHLRKESLLNKWCWGNWKATCKTMNIDYNFPHVKKLIKNGSKT